MSYQSLKAASRIFYRCEEVASNKLPNDGTAGPMDAFVVDPDIVQGMFGKAADFQNGLAYGDHSSPGIAVDDDFEMGGWFKTPSDDHPQVSCGLRFGTTVSDGVFLTPFSRWAGGSSGRGANVYYEAADDTDFALTWTVADDASVEDAAFHWFSVQRSGTTLSLFFDDPSSAVASTTISDLSSTPTDFIVGGYGGVSGVFDGLGDDIFLFDRTLSSDERAALFAGPRVDNHQTLLIPG